MCVTLYTAKCPESLIYARFRAFFVQSALRGGRLLAEKPQFFDDLGHAQPVHDFFYALQNFVPSLWKNRRKTYKIGENDDFVTEDKISSQNDKTK